MIKLQVNINSKDYDSRSALHIASSNNYIEIAKILLETPGIIVNPIDAFEMTPLREAQMNGFAEMSSLLRKHGGVVVHQDIG